MFPGGEGELSGAPDPFAQKDILSYADRIT